MTKTIHDLHEQEFEMLDKFCGILQDKGYETELINNMEYSPTIVIRLLNDDKEIEKYCLLFDYAGIEKGE